MRAQLPWFCAVFALLVVLPPGNSVVDVAAEPHHHLVLQNAYMRAFRVEVPAHEPTLPHHHSTDYVSVSLADAAVENDVEGKPPVTTKSLAGDARLVNGGFTHQVKNLADTPFRNMTVEILRTPPSSAPAEASSHPQPAKIAEGVVKTAKGESAAVRVSETVINAGVTVPEHSHSVPHLLIAISNLNLQSNTAGKPPQAVRVAAGDVAWFDAGIKHSVTNISQEPARYVTVEFK